ncbi:MAG: hypothetical protein JW740_02845 [Candidatus Zambryskibacteria bacterium]|nr:hypothetical protein [Candidatus Zambryskibacteria bacterium]
MKKFRILTCSICEKKISEFKAFVPPLDIITDDREIDLEDVILEEHVCCARCSGLTIQDCSEAKFHYYKATEKLIQTILKKRAERASYEAEQAKRQTEYFRDKNFEIQSKYGVSACLTTHNPFEGLVAVKIVDRNGNSLRGAAAHNQVRKFMKKIPNDSEPQRKVRRPKKQVKREDWQYLNGLSAAQCNQRLREVM